VAWYSLTVAVIGKVVCLQFNELQHRFMFSKKIPRSLGLRVENLGV